MTPERAKILVKQSQLSHARLGLSAAANNTMLASSWLAEVQRLDREVGKLEAAEAAAQEQAQAAA